MIIPNLSNQSLQKKESSQCFIKLVEYATIILLLLSGLAW